MVPERLVATMHSNYYNHCDESETNQTFLFPPAGLLPVMWGTYRGRDSWHDDHPAQY